MNCDRSTVSVPGCQIGFGKFVIRDLYALLQEILHDGGGYLLNNFNSNQEKWKSLQSISQETNSPYKMKFLPPSEEGGWMGKLRANEEIVLAQTFYFPSFTVFLFNEIGRFGVVFEGQIGCVPN